MRVKAAYIRPLMAATMMATAGCAAAARPVTAPPGTVRVHVSTPWPAPPPPPGTHAATVHRVVAAAVRSVVAPPPAPSSPPAQLNVPPSAMLATLSQSISSYAYPDGPSNGTVPGTWYGYQSVLPVIAASPGWVEVRLAQRPNMSVTWVRTSDVTLSDTTYHLVLRLGSMHLLVFDGGQQIASFPAGVGTPNDPTPTGTFFVAFRAPPPNSSYGPFMLVTSAHSNSISDWEGEGDAITAIHGPITARDDARIGSTGARISHGCVRLHDSDVAQLDVIPPGTPLDVIS